MFLTTLFGSNGGLTQSELNSETQRSKFSNYLPWVTYDETTRAYSNIDNSTGFIFECQPMSFAGKKTVSILEGLFRLALPENAVLQFILFADNDISHILNRFKSIKTRVDPIVQSSTEMAAKFLQDGTKGLKALSGIPVRNFRLFVTLKVPSSEEVNLRELHDTTAELLKGANLFPEEVTPGILLDWMRRMMNGSCANSFNYDETIPIRKQVILSETVVEKSMRELRFGNQIFRCTTPKVFPNEVHILQTNELFGGIWGVASDTEQILTPFMYTLNIVFEDLKAKLHSKCNMMLQQQEFGSFAPAQKRKKEEFLWAVDSLEKGVKFVKVVPELWVWGDNETVVTESITRAKRLWESQGFIMQEDRGILPIIFISSLPLGLYTAGGNVGNMDRDFIVPADTASSLFPIQADFAGGGKPALIYNARKGQIISLNIFDKRANNHNALVAGTSGGGKSFNMNKFVSSCYDEGMPIRIVDLGGSYKKLCRMYRGLYMDFTEYSNINLNPFTHVADLREEISVLAAIILQMIYSSTDAVPPDTAETAMSLIKLAIQWAWEKEGTDASVDTVYEFLKTFPFHDRELDAREAETSGNHFTHLAQTLAFNLVEFTSKGTYGKWFNGRSNFDISKDEFVVLELEHLKARKELLKVVSLQVINAMSKDLYLSDRSRPREYIYDEAREWIRDNPLMAIVLEEAYRRGRKYYGGSTIVTQSILDLKIFGIVGDVIRANSAFKFFLQSDDFEKAKAEKLIDYDDFTMKLLKSVKSNKPKYSEIFMDTPFGVGIARLTVDPFSYYIYTSEGNEVAEIEAMVASGKTYVQAIHAMVQKYRS